MCCYKDIKVYLENKYYSILNKKKIDTLNWIIDKNII